MCTGYKTEDEHETSLWPCWCCDRHIKKDARATSCSAWSGPDPGMTCQKLSSVSAAIKGHGIPRKGIYLMSSFPRAGVGALSPLPSLFFPRLPHRQLALHAFCAASTLGLAKRLARGVQECVCVCVFMWLCAVLVSPNSRLQVSAPPPPRAPPSQWNPNNTLLLVQVVLG